MGEVHPNQIKYQTQAFSSLTSMELDSHIDQLSNEKHKRTVRIQGENIFKKWWLLVV